MSRYDSTYGDKWIILLHFPEKGTQGFLSRVFQNRPVFISGKHGLEKIKMYSNRNNAVAILDSFEAPVKTILQVKDVFVQGYIVRAVDTANLFVSSPPEIICTRGWYLPELVPDGVYLDKAQAQEALDDLKSITVRFYQDKLMSLKSIQL